MDDKQGVEFKPTLSPGALASQDGAGAWHLEIPAGPEGRYRLAQIDDYSGIKREAFPWNPPVHLSLSAKASHHDLPGTWGFGLWNDPFSLSSGLGGGTRRWPVLPNAVWFFFASTPNYLSLRDDLPAQGNLVATFRSPLWPSLLLACGAVTMPLLLWSPGARLLRRLGRRIVHQDAVEMDIDPMEWHTYMFTWQQGRVSFLVDGDIIHETKVSPEGPLGVVIWIDNQFAALPPSGNLSYGTLANPEPAWVEVGSVSVSS